MTFPPPISTVTVDPELTCQDIECNTLCTGAIQITTDGTVHSQQFVEPDDSNWIYFKAEAHVDHLIEASLDLGVEATDIRVELYKTCDATSLIESKYITSSQNIRLTYYPTTTGNIYLKAIDVGQENTQSSSSQRQPYELSITNLSSPPGSGALIILGSRLDDDDTQQFNINNLAQHVYNLYSSIYPSDNIRLFIESAGASRDSSDNKFLPSKQKLEYAIKTWAKEHVGENRPLTLYLVGHANKNYFYIDKPNKEWLTPDDLDSWLTELEGIMPEIDINIIIESF